MRTIIVGPMPPVKRDLRSKPAPVPQRFSSEQLLGRAGQAVIVHNGREYRLRLTQSGKLILTA